MLKYLLDTNLCIRVLRDGPQGLRERFDAEASSLSISSVVLYELLFGAAQSARPAATRVAKIMEISARKELWLEGP